MLNDTPDTKLRFPVILFDLGNTLIYFDGDWPRVFPQCDLAMLERLKQAGLDLDEGDFLRQYDESLKAYYEQRDTEFIEYTSTYILRKLLAEWGYPDVSDEVLRSALDAWYAVEQEYWKVEADTHATLQFLCKAGYRLGMISNAADDKDVQVLVDRAGIRPYFDLILSSASLGIRKPNPLIFHAALAHWGVKPSQAMMVGDTLGADILGARNAGLYSVWITRRADTAANRAHADTVLPEAIIQDFGGLLELLRL